MQSFSISVSLITESWLQQLTACGWMMVRMYIRGWWFNCFFPLSLVIVWNSVHGRRGVYGTGLLLWARWGCHGPRGGRSFVLSDANNCIETLLVFESCCPLVNRRRTRRRRLQQWRTSWHREAGGGQSSPKFYLVGKFTRFRSFFL